MKEVGLYLQQQLLWPATKHPQGCFFSEPVRSQATPANDFNVFTLDEARFVEKMPIKHNTFWGVGSARLTS